MPKEWSVAFTDLGIQNGDIQLTAFECCAHLRAESDLDFQFYTWVALGKMRQQHRMHFGIEIFWRAEAHPAGDFNAFESAFRFTVECKNSACEPDEDLAVSRKDKAPSVALEDFSHQLIFESLYVEADCRLREIDHASCLCEAARFDNAGEVMQVTQLDWHGRCPLF